MKQHKVEFEILKFVLIISIVVGHALSTPLINVFWYHVPGFFMLTGYFCKKPIGGNLLNISSILTHKLRRYVIPYFSYSIVLYILFQQEPVIKNLIRVLLAGGWNVSLYSYPFWFINALFAATIVFDLVLYTFKRVKSRRKENLMMASLFMGIWMFVHCNAVFPFPIYLPWSIDQSLGALVFIYIGYIMKGATLKWWYGIFPLVTFVFTLLHYFYPVVDCHLNMCPMTFRNIIVDMVVPVAFVVTFYILALGLSRIPRISTAFGYVGSASFTIFFTHAAVIAAWPWNVTWWTVFSAVCGGTLLHAILNRYNFTRILFIGK